MHMDSRIIMLVVSLMTFVAYPFLYTNNLKNRVLTASGPCGPVRFAHLLPCQTVHWTVCLCPQPHNFRSHSRPLRASSLRSPASLANSPPDCLPVSAASRQWSLAPNKNSEDPSCQIPDSSSCLCIYLVVIGNRWHP